MDRKAVASLPDGDGLNAPAIADQLGQARISMTQDVYTGRRMVDQAVTLALGGPLAGTDDGDPAAAVVVI